MWYYGEYVWYYCILIYIADVREAFHTIRPNNAEELLPLHKHLSMCQTAAGNFTPSRSCDKRDTSQIETDNSMWSVEPPSFHKHTGGRVSKQKMALRSQCKVRAGGCSVTRTSPQTRASSIRAQFSQHMRRWFVKGSIFHHRFLIAAF